MRTIQSMCGAALLGLLLGGAAMPVGAQSFEEAVTAARRADGQYGAAQAGAQSRRAQARTAASAYLPYANASYNQQDTSAGARSTRSVSLTQPILSYDRWLTMQQADPLQALAAVEALQADNELILRVFSAMAEVVRLREQLRTLQAQAEGFDEQLRRANRMRELGQGTVTEVSDFETRVAAARASRISLANSLQVAERTFTQLTGLRADTASMSVQPSTPWPDPPGLDALAAFARDGAVGAVQARLNVDLARIAARRVNARYLPEVSAQALHYQSSLYGSSNRTGVLLSLSTPLAAATYFEHQRAALQLTQAEESLRYAQDSATTEASRLWASRQALREEAAVRQQAVASARLSVEANVRSYQGGVKSNIDVISAYQALSDAEMALVTTRLQLAETELRLHLLQRQPGA